MIERVPLSSIKPNPANPRVIRDFKFKAMVNSLLALPQMLSARGFVVADGVTIGSNQRLRAAQHIVKLSHAEFTAALTAVIAKAKSIPDSIKEARKAESLAIWQPIRETKAVPAEWVYDASHWSESQKAEFVIKDNTHYGEFDMEALANEWDAAPLDDWGVNVGSAADYSDKNKEIDVNSFDDEMVIKLKYTEDEYHIVKGQLQKIAQTPEQAVWKLLGNE
jgi:hypothetical protein